MPAKMIPITIDQRRPPSCARGRGLGLVGRLAKAIGDGGLQGGQGGIEIGIGRDFCGGQRCRLGRLRFSGEKGTQLRPGRNVGRHLSGQMGARSLFPGRAKRRWRVRYA